MAERLATLHVMVLAVVLAMLLALGLARPALATGAAAPSAPPAVAGALMQDGALWQTYVSRFVQPDGRVIDNVNGNISHTESQGYGMLLAVAANDRETFARIWDFTERNLYVRPDGLGSWKWQPASEGGATLAGSIADRNNATDGDILIAWALAEAGAAGWDDAYTARANVLVSALRATFYAQAPFGMQIMPGKEGFSAAERDGRPVINLSYWVFPAFQRLAVLAPQPFWADLTKSGEAHVQRAEAFPSALPPDWIVLDAASGSIGVAPGFDDAFSYNAIRIPLYLAMTGPSSRRILRAAFEHWFQINGPLHTVGVTDRALREPLQDPGYEAIRSIYFCATRGRPIPADMHRSLDANYYPATLQLLALMAVRQSFPKCV